LETIRDNVVEGLASGKSEEEVIALTMEKLQANTEFTKLKMFSEWAEMNVRGVYRQIAAKEGKLN
jgi:hypothetical protein